MSRVVLVTGCSTGGIGFALCNEFAQQGCKVYATSRKVETIGEFSRPSIEKLVLDVTDDAGVEGVVKHIVEAEGKIDIVVNNAGYFSAGPLIDQTIDDIKTNFDTNTFSILRVAKAVIPLMAKRRSGVIVNIGSIVGEVATPWNGIYCASKAAAQSISDVLSMECRPFNISVFHVAPGGIQSNISDKGSARFKLPEGSLYRGFIPNIMKRIYASGIKGVGEDSAPVFEHWSKFDVICNSQVASKVMGVVAYVENVFQDLTPRPSAWPASEIPTEKRTATTRLGIVAFEPRYTMSRFPDYLSPNVTPTKLPKAHKSRARREPSGVFSLFKPPQIQQFKEAFQLIDHDKDGWVTEDDLKEIFSSLGITPSKQMLDDLLSARPGGGRMAYSEDRGINFTMFLTMMSERLFEFDTEKELLEAFESFDEDDTGMVKVAEMRKWLGEVGERMDKDEIERLLEGSFSDRQGQFHYREWVKVLRVNVDDEGAEHT